MGSMAMHLILTHEQADFDALASLLAAHLLHPEALAVLPRRLNRNVHAYLTLYGERFPFEEFQDLPRGHVDRLTLVDTQSSVSIKGVTKTTEVHVIDHHPEDEALNPAWTAHLEDIGATTTLLVESLRQENIKLDLVIATLLLLGIYEDTGSLSYAATTPRDVRAAAWLLEAGASLDIASNFLNHPLSPDQRDLFNQLFEAVETFEIHGLSIVIACGVAGDMVDEISTLAHKLRDVFDPDGLVVLVALNGAIQLVGRSSSSLLDISRVAEHFGGGGHDRAAAALIKDRSLAEVNAELHELLPQIIEPVKTVAEIMSRDPRVLNPETSIADALARMQRSGHEGFPVVEGKTVKGLLTRRAVDRAVTHGMQDRPISSIMDAGDLTVHPGDSVQRLQRAMIHRGWGQVPVADPESGEIIGIVTRTDLLKILGAAVEEPPLTNLGDRLESALKPERLALLKKVAEEAMAHKSALYIVGGFVRDLLLREPSVDFDLVVEGDAIGLAKGLASKYGGRISSHRRFGTAKWHLDRENKQLLKAVSTSAEDGVDLPADLDFVSARTEFYTHPTALPSVERGSIKLDLHRRDFTINTLALRLDGRHYGQLLDHWGGGRDLRDRKIRVLHSISFVDDPTRMLRAVRLEQRLNFEIEARTLELLRQALPLLDRVSGERLRNELVQIFHEDRMPQIMARLQELDLLRAIHPTLIWDEWLESRVSRVFDFEAPPAWRLEDPPEQEFLIYTLLFFRLSQKEIHAVCDRLHFPSGLMGQILEAASLGRELPSLVEDAKASELTARMDECREAALAAAWLALQGETQAQDAIERYLSVWRFVEPKSDGEALRALGLPPGPGYRRILWALRAAWIDEELHSEAEEKVLLHKLIEREASHGRGA
jgi:tRNA nucleotidyltransferase (CCA-adding enzyme)